MTTLEIPIQNTFYYYKQQDYEIIANKLKHKTI